VGGTGPAHGVGRLGDVEAVVPGVGVPRHRRARVRHPDGARRARHRLVVPVPRGPEAGGLHRRRAAARHGWRLDAEAQHAVLLRPVVVVAGALLVGARLSSPLKNERQNTGSDIVNSLVAATPPL
jgi:hypothetical protein